MADLGARLQPDLARARTRAPQFLWRVLSGTCLYAAGLVPEISDDVVSIDRAMEWGYGWGHGPFRLLDALGVAAVAERARAEGRTVPPLVEALLASGPQALLRRGGRARRPCSARTACVPVPDRPGVIDAGGAEGTRGAVKKKNPGASLVDLGDGVGLVEFHSQDEHARRRHLRHAARRR